MPQNIKQLFYRYLPALAALLMLATFFWTRGFFSNPKPKIIFSDGYGYYAYLPAIFIHHDLTYSFAEKFDKEYYDGNGNSSVLDFRRTEGNRYLNQFFAGTALLQMPFFLAAHGLSAITGLPTDGYSVLYQYFIALAGVFWLWLGVFFLYRLLIGMGFKRGHSALSIIFLLFGTNLFYYAIYEPSMSHVYSFASISGFLYFSLLHFQGKYKSAAVLAAFFLALLILIRPVNVIVIALLPFVAGSWKSLKEGIATFFTVWRKLVPSLILLAIITGIQLILWKLQTGKFFLWPYKGQGFDFTHPELFRVLFSWKKGLFLYAPMTMLAFAGIFGFLKNEKFRYFSLLIFLCLMVYVVSSWWCWWYGMSFGLRAFIDFYAVAGILLAAAFRLFRGKVLRIAFFTLCFCCLALNQVQAYQYRYYILHWDLMTKDKYMAVFLRTGEKYKGALWKDFDNGMTFGSKGSIDYSSVNDFENYYKYWTLGRSTMITLNNAFSGEISAMLRPQPSESPGYSRNLNSFPQWVIGEARFSMQVKSDETGSRGNLVIALDSAGSIIHESSKPFIIGKKDSWQTVSISMRFPEWSSTAGTIRAFAVNRSREPMYIDDFSVQVSVLK